MKGNFTGRKPKAEALLRRFGQVQTSGHWKVWQNHQVHSVHCECVSQTFLLESSFWTDVNLSLTSCFLSLYSFSSIKPELYSSDNFRREPSWYMAEYLSHGFVLSRDVFQKNFETSTTPTFYCTEIIEIPKRPKSHDGCGVEVVFLVVPFVLVLTCLHLPFFVFCLCPPHFSSPLLSSALPSALTSSFLTSSPLLSVFASLSCGFWSSWLSRAS